MEVNKFTSQHSATKPNVNFEAICEYNFHILLLESFS
jgi:hypothetical protein